MKNERTLPTLTTKSFGEAGHIPDALFITQDDPIRREDVTAVAAVLCQMPGGEYSK